MEQTVKLFFEPDCLEPGHFESPDFERTHFEPARPEPLNLEPSGPELAQSGPELAQSGSPCAELPHSEPSHLDLSPAVPLMVGWAALCFVPLATGRLIGAESPDSPAVMLPLG